MKNTLIELAKCAGILNSDSSLFRTNSGQLEILCDDGIYRSEFDLKMEIGGFDYAQMPL